MSWSGLPENIESRIIPEPNSGCWLWMGAPRNKLSGYGSAWHDGKQWLSHRIVFILLKGVVELPLDHLCRNRICCNPDHLEPVTSGTNLLRGETLAAENAAKTHCVNGHEFTEENTHVRKSRNGMMRCCRKCACDRVKLRCRLMEGNEREAHLKAKRDYANARYHRTKTNK